MHLGIVEVRDLTYTYPSGSEPVLRDINISIETGEFILLTGPSGCGKTTFCRSLNGLIPNFYNGAMEGEVIVNGLSTLDNPIKKMAQNVGLIFQNPDNQIFALTVEKDLAFGLENLGYTRDRIKDEISWAMKVTGIEHLKDRATHELSGGQKQRLTIAGVLAMRPKVIVMDEPTSFLDPVGAENIFDVLKNLNEAYGLTIILIEHRMDLAVNYVDRVIVFNDGRVVSDGKPKEVFASEETRLIGVGIPRILELAKKLRSHGIDLQEYPITVNEMYELLTSRLMVLRDKNYTSSEYRVSEETVNEKHPLIEVENVFFSYPGDVEALRGVSLTVDQGDFLAIMGENGAGKSTLIKHFNGLLKPDQGSVVFDGRDISSSSVAEMSKRIGLVFQNPDDQLFEEDVEKEISFALKNFGYSDDVIEKRVNWALGLLDIERYRDTSPFILSGGERKRVALASVLAWDPDVLVLDEPTIGQDHGQKEKLQHFLMQLRTQGKTTIVVTHDVEFVAESNPRLVLMAKGKIIADGPARKIMTDEKALSNSSVSPPEVTKLFKKLGDFGLPTDVLDVDEATRLIERHLEVQK